MSFLNSRREMAPLEQTSPFCPTMHWLVPPAGQKHCFMQSQVATAPAQVDGIGVQPRSMRVVPVLFERHSVPLGQPLGSHCPPGGVQEPSPLPPSLLPEASLWLWPSFPVPPSGLPTNTSPPPHATTTTP